MARTQGCHGHRDGMNTEKMTWTQRWHGHSDDMGHSDTQTHDQMHVGWPPGPVAQDVRRRHAARYSSLRRAPCASRSPSEPTASPSKIRRRAHAALLPDLQIVQHLACRSRLKPQVGKSGRRSLAAPRRRFARPFLPLCPLVRHSRRPPSAPDIELKPLLHGRRALVRPKRPKLVGEGPRALVARRRRSPDPTDTLAHRNSPRAGPRSLPSSAWIALLYCRLSMKENNKFRRQVKTW